MFEVRKLDSRRVLPIDKIHLIVFNTCSTALYLLLSPSCHLAGNQGYGFTVNVDSQDVMSNFTMGSAGVLRQAGKHSMYLVQGRLQANVVVIFGLGEVIQFQISARFNFLLLNNLLAFEFYI